MSTSAKIGLAAFLLAWLFSGIASAEPQLEPGSPAPLLDGRAYPDYRCAPESEWTVEEATLEPGARLSVDVDAWGAATFTLELQNVDPERWPERALELLGQLHTSSDGATPASELQAFLRELDRAAQVRGPGSVRYELCRDGSLPSEEGCGLETGGGYSAEVELRGDLLRVALTDEPAL